MADKVSYPRPAGSDEFQVAKFKPGYKSFTDPDKGWQWTSNPNYSHDKWYSTPNGAWEKRLNSPSVVDTFSNINFNKLPMKPGEYYSSEYVPVCVEEFDEEAYWDSAEKSKTDAQYAEELAAPVTALESRWADYCKNAYDSPRIPLLPIWTPAMAMMVAMPKQARVVNFELAPFFQLNSLGYRKNWANTSIAEMRFFKRPATVNANFYEDYFLRWQMQRVRFTNRVRFTVFKAYIFISIIGAFVDQCWCREYRLTRKFH